MKDIYDLIADFETKPETAIALATLVRVQGSSYRRPGARLLIRPSGHIAGSLSGGCIEEEIAQRAKGVLETGEPLLIDFDTRRQFGCHGRIGIFIERIEGSLLRIMTQQLNERRPLTLTTTFAGDEHPLGTQIGEIAGDSANRLVQVVHPPTRLLIFGEGPDSAPLRKLCGALGWQALEFDDASAIADIGTDDWTAAIVKSHNFGRDFAALSKLLPLDLRYVGLIGPKKRRDELLNELLQIDIPMNAGFFAPAGLDLNAETPEEIALSVVSEIQRVFADGSGKSLRDRKEPIHDRPASPTRRTNRWQTSPP